ncbi:MAG: mechanosensitive ion channel [Bacteroidetes bacterium]|uniref:Mechanosensitive ion channel n=1 Tax=Candidatus Cryptobacteroides excrementavium TaxID=2840759 RepID=A0A9D9NQZ6_9BACT|nr:mechanosensitive ion channel [Candidatus Cryptobacteroides excrementavium]
MEQNTLEIFEMTIQTRIIVSCAIVLLAYLVDFLCCRLLIPLARRLAAKTAYTWDNYITDSNVLRHAFHLIPPVTFLVALPLLFPETEQWTILLSKGFSIYIIVVACSLACAFVSSLYAISSESEVLKDKPMKGVYQMVKVLIVCVGIVLTIGVLIEKDFTTLLAGLGASAAVLMLIFKDTILGLVAGVQLSAHDMLRPGDWIMMDKHGINGEVEEVTLNTVKVRNWDNTITTVPPYTLVSDSFKNWRAMRESAGRRVTRAIRIDINTIRTCTPEESATFSRQEWAKGIQTETGTVNLKFFRAAAEYRIRTNPDVNADLMLLVRQLEPTPEGLPLQLYFFTKAKDWVTHERVAADIVEEILAMMPEFGLRAYQKPSGMDFSGYN